MLILYETPAGYSLFKVSDAKAYGKLAADDIHDTLFRDAANASQSLQLVSFQAFADTADAVSAITACQEGRVGASLHHFLTSKRLKKLLKRHAASGGSSSSSSHKLAVADKALAISLKQDDVLTNAAMKVVHDDKTDELFRGIRCYMEELLCSGNTGDGDDDAHNGGGENSCNVTAADLHKMQLGLSHSLGRYKLKFSADKVDTMVIQAVGLLDELDKEINTYAMRVKEWYGWHFPELQAIASDNATYAKLVLAAGHRHMFKDADLSSIYENSSAGGDSDASAAEIAAVKEAAEISMGTDITDNDVLNIQSLADQVLSMTEYRAQLFEYLKNRMNAIAPNLTILTGELVGARLIAHAGSLLNLAKQPASTVQILGAEKALFRALKTKHDTPKYGLIYHASLIGQAAPKHKGKISRVLAAKASLAIRVDALSDDVGTDEHIDTTVGYEGRAKVEARLRQLEGGNGAVSAVGQHGNGSSSNLKAQKTAKYDPVAAKTASANVAYNTASDVMQLDDDKDSAEAEAADAKKEKKAKKDKKRKSKGDDEGENGGGDESAKKKKRKHSDADQGEHGDDEDAKKSAKKAAKKLKKEKRKSQE